jgi:hypothetical protein
VSAIFFYPAFLFKSNLVKQRSDSRNLTIQRHPQQVIGNSFSEVAFRREDHTFLKRST